MNHGIRARSAAQGSWVRTSRRRPRDHPLRRRRLERLRAAAKGGAAPYAARRWPRRPHRCAGRTGRRRLVEGVSGPTARPVDSSGTRGQPNTRASADARGRGVGEHRGRAVPAPAASEARGKRVLPAGAAELLRSAASGRSHLLGGSGGPHVELGPRFLGQASGCRASRAGPDPGGRARRRECAPHARRRDRPGLCRALPAERARRDRRALRRAEKNHRRHHAPPGVGRRRYPVGAARSRGPAAAGAGGSRRGPRRRRTRRPSARRADRPGRPSVRRHSRAGAQHRCRAARAFRTAHQFAGTASGRAVRALERSGRRCTAARRQGRVLPRCQLDSTRRLRRLRARQPGEMERPRLRRRTADLPAPVRRRPLARGVQKQRGAARCRRGRL